MKRLRKTYFRKLADEDLGTAIEFREMSKDAPTEEYAREFRRLMRYYALAWRWWFYDVRSSDPAGREASTNFEFCSAPTITTVNKVLPGAGKDGGGNSEKAT